MFNMMNVIMWLVIRLLCKKMWLWSVIVSLRWNLMMIMMTMSLWF